MNIIILIASIIVSTGMIIFSITILYDAKKREEYKKAVLDYHKNKYYLCGKYDKPKPVIKPLEKLKDRELE